MKHKRLLSCSLAFSLIAASGMFCGFSGVEKPLDTADQCLMNYIANDATDVDYTRAPLYNKDLQQTGWDYAFTADGVAGYALLSTVTVQGESVYEVQEFKLNEQSPFENCEGYPVFVTHNTYIDYRSDLYFNMMDNSVFSAREVEDLSARGFAYFTGETAENADMGYSGGVTGTSFGEVINYDHKTKEEYQIPSKVPDYCSVPGGCGCANIAGAIVVGYYDRMCENLLPNYKSYSSLGSYIFYKDSSTTIENLINTLYTLMGTDVAQAGTTFSGYQSGMAQYATNYGGYTYSSSSVKTLGAFDMSKFATSVQSGKPVALFLPAYTFVGIGEYDNYDDIGGTYYTTAHVAIAFGYRIETYYDADNVVIATRRYLRVASGFTTTGITYLNLDNSTMNEAIASLIA